MAPEPGIVKGQQSAPDPPLSTRLRPVEPVRHVHVLADLLGGREVDGRVLAPAHPQVQVAEGEVAARGPWPHPPALGRGEGGTQLALRPVEYLRTDVGR